MNRKKFLPYFITFFFAFKALAQPAKLEACISDLMQQSKIAGLSVAVVKDNKIIYTHSFGLKNIGNNTPLTDDCLFRIASISKSFTATSLMQLVEAKKTIAR